MSDKKDDQKGSFWTTIPGCITAMAALITAFGGLLAVLYGAGFLTPPPTATPIPLSTTVLITSIPPTEIFTPIVISNTYNIAQYGGEPGTQRSQQLDYIITVRTVDLLQFEFSVPSDVPSSDVILHILWDDVEIYTSDPIGGAGGRYTTNLIDLSPYVSQGVHELTISPEGVFGGGNVGYLSAWGGTLIVHTNIYP